MEWLQNNDVIINLALFKQYHFYHIFNPNGPKVFNYSVYKLIHVVFVVIIICFTIFSTLTFVLETRHQVFEDIELLLIMVIYNGIFISFIKILVFLYKADTVWNLFNFTRLDFLTSKLCHKHTAILYKYRKKSIRNTNFFLNYCIIVFVLWAVFPLLLNALTKPATLNLRYYNIFNLRYPISTSIFNEYYYVFYLIEMSMELFILYYSVLIDNYLISFCWAIISQLEVITLAYESIGAVEDAIEKPQNDSMNNCVEEYYEDFKSAVRDHINVIILLRSFYSVVWIIVALLIVINSAAMIVLTYSLIAERFSIFDIIKLSAVFCSFGFEIFIYCYLFDVINMKVITSIFNIVSIMLKTLNKKS